MRPSALIWCASFQNEAQRGPRVASEASDSGPRSWRASPPAEARANRRFVSIHHFFASSYRRFGGGYALAYNIALLIYVRFIGRLAKLPNCYSRLALCDRWLGLRARTRVPLYGCCIALARVGAAGQCVHWSHRNAVRPLGAFMCVSLCLRSE